jgi:hypothetical protein
MAAKNSYLPTIFCVGAFLKQMQQTLFIFCTEGA